MSYAIYQRIAPLCAIQKYLRGEVIVEDPNTVDHLFYVVSGAVAVEYMGCDDGGRIQPQTVMHHTRGEFLSIASYFNHKMKRPVKLKPTRYVADTTCYIARVRYVLLDKALYGSMQEYADEVRDALTAALLTRSSHLVGRVTDLCTTSVMTKMKHALEQLACTHGSIQDGKVRIEISNRHQLSEMIGSSREVVSRYFTSLSEEGYLTVNVREITLLKPSEWVIHRIQERDEL